MFSQTVEYALRAMIHLAASAPRACTTDQIATTTQVPRAYLSKVLQGLSQAGLVRSQRGLRGGISLGKTPETLTILEIVNAVEPLQRIRTCPLNLESHGTHLCPLHQRMDDAIAAVEEAFRETTLAELLAEPSASVPLCNFPGPSGSTARLD